MAKRKTSAKYTNIHAYMWISTYVCLYKLNVYKNKININMCHIKGTRIQLKSKKKRMEAFERISATLPWNKKKKHLRQFFKLPSCCPGLKITFWTRSWNSRNRMNERLRQENHIPSLFISLFIRPEQQTFLWPSFALCDLLMFNKNWAFLRNCLNNQF